MYFDNHHSWKETLQVFICFSLSACWIKEQNQTSPHPQVNTGGGVYVSVCAREKLVSRMHVTSQNLECLIVPHGHTWQGCKNSAFYGVFFGCLQEKTAVNIVLGKKNSKLHLLSHLQWPATAESVPECYIVICKGVAAPPTTTSKNRHFIWSFWHLTSKNVLSFWNWH